VFAPTGAVGLGAEESSALPSDGGVKPFAVDAPPDAMTEAGADPALIGGASAPAMPDDAPETGAVEAMRPAAAKLSPLEADAAPTSERVGGATDDTAPASVVETAGAATGWTAGG
jgi:hypothetical protein